ncbi:MAG: branched-chain amino acid transport system permease protein [Methylobacteriaceae bacterium]|nr:branched-chain amino acid transport system permease protein [Methylobacteriaceae bacterium]
MALRAAAPDAFDVRRALKDAALAAIITAGLAFPILALRAEPDIDNRLTLQGRWSWLFIASAIVFVGRFLLALFDVRPRRKPATDAALPASAYRAARFIGPAGLALLFVFPLAVFAALGPQGSLKWIDNYGIQILIYVMLGWGLNIVVGLAGLLDLGYVAFYAVGAYSYALLSTTFGLSFWLCLPLAGILAAFWGMLLGFPVLRLRGDYLAIVTMAFGEIIRIVLVNWSVVTNGDAGISSIPRASFFGLPFTAGPNGFAATFGIKFSPIHRVIFLYYLILCLAVLTNFVTVRLRRLPIGRAWEALREDEIACRSLGLDTVKLKLAAFALGAMFGGFAGAFFSVRQGFVSPSSFTFIESATILAIVVLGGRGSQLGVALAAVVIIGGSEILRELDFLKQIFGEEFDPTQYRMLIVGMAMVMMMNWRPRGLVATRAPTIALGERRAIAGALVKEGHG